MIRGGANPIVLPPPPGSSGVYSYVPQVRFGASGDFVAATSYNDGGLGAGRVRPAQPRAPASAAAVALRCTPRRSPRPGPPGEIGAGVLPRPDDPAREQRAAGSRAATCCSRPRARTASSCAATSAARLAAPTGDCDGDGVEDALDVCPVEPNAGAARLGRARDGARRRRSATSVSAATRANDGRVDGADVDALRAFLAGSLATLAGAAEVRRGRARRAALRPASTRRCCGARSPARAPGHRACLRAVSPVELPRDVKQLGRACASSPVPSRSTPRCARATTCGSCSCTRTRAPRSVAPLVARAAKRGIRGAHGHPQRDRASLPRAPRRGDPRARRPRSGRRPRRRRSRAAARSGCWSASPTRATSAW